MESNNNPGQGGEVSPNTSTPVAAAPSAIPSPAEPLAAGLNREQTTMLGWIDEDEASGKMTKEQAQQARKETVGQDFQPAKDSRSPEEKIFDSTWPSARPEDFSFPRYENENLTAEQKAADLGARKMLSAAGFTREMGSHLATVADRFMIESHEWTPDQRTLYQRSSMLQLENVYQGALQANLALARSFVEQWEQRCPGVRAFLEKTGLGDHPQVIGQIVNHARRLSTRGSKQK
jgi:hypothetical protein